MQEAAAKRKLAAASVFHFFYCVISLAYRAEKFDVGKFHISLNCHICYFKIEAFGFLGIAVNDLGYFFTKQPVAAARTEVFLEKYKERVIAFETVSFDFHAATTFFFIVSHRCKIARKKRVGCQPVDYCSGNAQDTVCPLDKHT